jgi:hypothetical protein
LREAFGCGVAGFAGRGSDTRFPEVATCSVWLCQQPWVDSVYGYLGAYRTGNLGSVFDLPAALFDALIVLDGELKIHEAELQKQMMAD